MTTLTLQDAAGLAKVQRPVAKYPRATRTEPGDVTFVEKPRPRVEAAREPKTALINGVAAGALTLDVEHGAPGFTGASK